MAAFFLFLFTCIIYILQNVAAYSLLLIRSRLLCIHNKLITKLIINYTIFSKQNRYLLMWVMKKTGLLLQFDQRNCQIFLGLECQSKNKSFFIIAPPNMKINVSFPEEFFLKGKLQEVLAICSFWGNTKTMIFKTVNFER